MQLLLTLDKRGIKCYDMQCSLGVAQLGSVLEWGSRGREFKSHHPDQRGVLLSGPLIFYSINER